MVAFNQINLAGNLTRDPEMRFTANGTPVCNFGIAVNTRYKDREEVLFMTCVVFGAMGENCDKYLVKGVPVMVSGRLQCRDWQTHEGETRKTYEVVANQVVFLGQPAVNKDERSQERSQTPSFQGAGQRRQMPAPDDDDIAF